VKRLYLSGNPLDNTFLQDACYNLIYLEVAACRLTVLPANFGALVPNVRVLNLNYNFVADLRPLDGLTRLKKLTLIGSRMTTSKALIKCIKGAPGVEMLDFRYDWLIRSRACRVQSLHSRTRALMLYQDEPVYSGVVFAAVGA
jgi:Leucine-rich repeat (LRR) protein